MASVGFFIGTNVARHQEKIKQVRFANINTGNRNELIIYKNHRTPQHLYIQVDGSFAPNEFLDKKAEDDSIDKYLK